jgi:ankyrin repeat protein
MSAPLLKDFAARIVGSDSSYIKSLLSTGEVDANARLPRESNPPALVHAARFSNVDVVELLLNAGARIDDVDDHGQSACHAASMRGDGDTDVMSVLLAHRPNLALKDMDGLTALRRAAQTLMPFRRNENENVATLLIRAGASLDDLDRTELCRLAATSTTLIQMLLNHSVAVGDLRDEFEQTPLHIATRNRAPSLMVLSKLVECGVPLEARSRDWISSTCSMSAVMRDSADALRLFLHAGANVDVNSLNGEPLLHVSVVRNNFKCTILLLAAGADVTARDGSGRTACFVAADFPTGTLMSFVHALLAVGADLDTADDSGQTPRMRLAERRVTVDPQQVESARHDIAKTRLDFVRYRAMEICIALQSLQLDALQTCEILQLACGPLARLIAFHQWWKIATTVKHFKL